MLSYYPVLILLAPLTAGLITGLAGRALGSKAGRICVGAELISFALSLGVLYDVSAHGPRLIQWTASGAALFQVAFYLDRLAAIMLVFIAAISTLIHLFSIRYMQQERGYTRFLSLLAFLCFVLFGMVSSANLLMLFLFWQLISWFLPLLSYNYTHVPTVRGAFRTFIMQRVGDLAFLAAIFLAYGLFGTLDIRQLAVHAAGYHRLLSLPGGLAITGATAIGLLIFVAAMSKSVQFPLHMWLPDSLYAPTPVTALLHAGIINAGGFLFARLASFYALSSTTLHAVFFLGMLTALLGSSMMLVQSDIKKTLGYSTIGQMGFMIMECGLGAFGLAIFHLIAHGLFKGSIFLNCGYVIHAARREPRLPHVSERTQGRAEFSPLSWLTGFFITLLIPLVILLAAHGVLRIPLGELQGTTIFLFFGWATSSQAILTMYKLQAVASWKLAVSMLAMLVIVVGTYLFAAESFSAFLFSRPGEVDYYLKAAALPDWLFDLIIAGFSLLVVLGWYLLYARSHGRTVPLPHWVRRLQVRIYLLLLNRLYLDALALRLRATFSHGIDALADSRIFPWVLATLAVVMALSEAVSLARVEFPRAILLLIAAGLLPLFPLHWIYIAALTRLPRYGAVLAAMALPAAGLYALAHAGPEIPFEIRQAVGTLALCGVLYEIIKALAQRRLPQLIAYGGCAFYSVFWWCVSSDRYDQAALLYAAATTLVIAALLFAAHLLQARIGHAALDRMHGLARPMPRFATVFAVSVMAAIGLFPFGFFSTYLEMLASSARTLSWAFAVVLLSWYVSSWYFFRMMQRLLFGPHRNDLRYEDLRTGEAAVIAALLLLSAALSFMPRSWFDDRALARASFVEWAAWRK